jgi:hypothetical protein
VRRGVFAGVVVGALLSVTPAATATTAAFGASLSAKPSVVDVGDPVRIELRVYTIVAGKKTLSDKPGRRLRVEAISPTKRVLRVPLRHVSRGVWRTNYRFRSVGAWNVRIGSWPNRHAPQLTVQVKPVGATTPPPGFAALGAPGCNPASPRNQNGEALARAEVFGTAVGGSFWGLFAFMPVADAWASDGTAVVQNVVGKEMKIVFKLDDFPSGFYAVGPTGSQTNPVWGPEQHTSSSWRRPGREWGAGFVFDRAGCWDIHATAGAVTGDIWLQVLS